MSRFVKVTIDGVDYEVSSDNIAANQILAHIRAIDLEVGRTQSLIAIYQTARKSYAMALKKALEARKEAPSAGVALDKIGYN